MATTLFLNASELITNRGVAKKGGTHVTLEDLGIIKDGAMLLDSKKGILWLGHSDDVPKALSKGAKKIDLTGKILSPTLIDCHTHLVFAGSRHEEFLARLSGSTYQKIAASGGGINSTVRATRAASEKELYDEAKNHLESSLKLGVGIFEVKSGYGLDWKNERKILKVIQKLKQQYKNKCIIKSTFLGAHAFPPEAVHGRDKINYAISITDDMLPKLKKEKLADAVDVFFDEGYFTKSQTRRILSQASRLGFDIKLHADELADTGGANLAAELGALSADHLLKVNDTGIQKMAKRGVVGVLLPTTAFYLGLGFAPFEKLKKAGVCVALASDFNPGSSPSFHLPFVMSLACLKMGMSPAESFAATTYGAARALNLHSEQGFLRVGLKPKISIFNVPSFVSLIQNFAHPGLCEAIY